MISEYKELNTFEDRYNESDRIKKKYPDKIPIILEKYKSLKLENIKKNKYLVPEDLTVSQFLFVIRKKINLSSEESIYLFCNNTLLCANSMFYDLYEKYRDDDNFLYLFYDSENTFG